jgi:hypothetical protein
VILGDTAMVSPEVRHVADPRNPRSVSLVARFASFDLPPVRDAVLLGKKAPIGPQAFHEALEHMLPGIYELVPVEHNIVEAILVRRDRLKLVSLVELLPVLLSQAEALMDETGCVHATLDVEVQVTVELTR